MTLEEMKTYDKEYLTAAQIATVLNEDPQALRIKARERPGTLGFPVHLSGKEDHLVKFPRLSFLKFMGVEV